MISSQVVSATVVSFGGAESTLMVATVDCPAGTVLLGGGGTVMNSNPDFPGRVSLIDTSPRGNGWQATGVINTTLFPGARMTVTVWAVCTR